MIKISIIAIGNIKEKFFTDAINEYSKRISAFADFSIIELKEQLITDNSKSTINKSLDKEAIDIQKYISPKDYVIVLDRLGEMLTSEKLADNIKNISLLGLSQIKFIIGSSFGLSDSIKQKANLLLSFSKFTMPHQLFRVVLTEQIYRALSINANKSYHK